MAVVSPLHADFLTKSVKQFQLGIAIKRLFGVFRSSVFSLAAGLKIGQSDRKRNFKVLNLLFLDCGSGF